MDRHLRLEFRELAAAEVRPLRTKILRPHFESSEVATFDGDTAERAHHFGLVEADGTPRAVSSYIPQDAPENSPERLTEPTIRLRGMAVDDGWRREGLGGRLLESSLTRIAILEPDIRSVWCNARVSAAEFYERFGFRRTGDVFEVPDIGPHVVMWRRLPTSVISL